MVKAGGAALSAILAALLLTFALSNGEIPPVVIVGLSVSAAVAIGCFLLKTGGDLAKVRFRSMVAVYVLLGVIGAPIIRPLFEHPHAAWLDVFGAVAAGWLVGRIPAIVRYGPLPV